MPSLNPEHEGGVSILCCQLIALDYPALVICFQHIWADPPLLSVVVPGPSAVNTSQGDSSLQAVKAHAVNITQWHSVTEPCFCPYGVHAGASASLTWRMAPALTCALGST